MTPRRFFIAVLAAWLAVALAACERHGASAGGPQAAPGAQGTRLVVLSPAVAIMLRDLGLADRVVGKHDWDLVLPEHVPAVGHQEAIDYEALIRARPDDILIEWGSRPLPPRLTELADANGWTLIPIRLLTLDDIAHTVDDLAIRYGVVDFSGIGRRPPDVPGASRLDPVPRFEDPGSRFEAELPSARLARAWSARGQDLSSIGPILLIGSTDPIGVLGPGSFHQQILERLGATPAITEGSPWLELDAEDVLRLAPAGIVLIAPARRGEAQSDGPTGEEVLGRLGRLATLEIPAVRTGRVALIDDPLALTPSTAMAGFADRLAEILESWRVDAGAPLPRP